MALTMNLTNVQREASTFKTATGEIVTLTDAKGEQYFRELQTTIDPVQDLHGYDHPWPVGGGKNKLQFTLDSIKALNTTGTWSGNTYTVGNRTYRVDTDNGGNVTQIVANGSDSSASALIILSSQTLDSASYILSGIRGGSAPTYEIGVKLNESSNFSHFYNTSSSISITSMVQMQFVVRANYSASNITVKPMLRLATESDETYEPPSNFCPIIGWSSAKVPRTGKNLLPFPYGSSPLTNNGITYTPNTDGSITVNGTATGNSYFNFRSWGASNAVPIMKSPRKVVIPTGGATDIYFRAQYREVSGGTAINLFDTMGAQVTIPDTVYDYAVFLNVPNGKTIDNVTVYPMIRPDGTDSTFEPYNPNSQTVIIDLGDTRYGGVLDVTRGKMVVTHGYAEFDGSNDENWNFSASFTATQSRAYISVSDIDTSVSDSSVLNIISNKYKANAYNAQTVVPRITGRKDYSQINVFVSTTTLEAFKASLSSTPLQVVYPLATPIEVDVDPEAIKTLDGINNIWADTGDVTVTYKVDPNAEPTLTLVSSLRANLGDLRPIVPEAEEIIAESEDPENGANLTTESEVQNGET